MAYWLACYRQISDGVRMMRIGHAIQGAARFGASVSARQANLLAWTLASSLSAWLQASSLLINQGKNIMSVNQLSCSQNGQVLIEKFEGLRLTAYQDMVGVWTIGYGHTGPDVKPGLVISQQQAVQLLINDLARFNNGVNALVTVKLNQNQFDALVSFSYNLGLGSLQNSTLLRLLNAGNFQAAADQFPRWDRAGGKEVAGLLARRNAERALFLTPV